MPDLTNYKLVRSHRKTLSIEITAEGSMIVRAPNRCSVGEIRKFILSKEEWIEKVINQQAKRTLLQIPEKIKENTTIPYLGSKYPVIWFDQKNPLIEGYCYLPIKWQGKSTQKKLILWMKKEAQVYLTKRTGDWSACLKIPIKSIAITSAKKRLGSCNRKKDIRFTWRIMMLPPTLIDYIILHELAHIKVHAHNKDFWKLMLEWLPTLPLLKKELKTYLIA